MKNPIKIDTKVSAADHIEMIRRSHNEPNDSDCVKSNLSDQSFYEENKKHS